MKGKALLFIFAVISTLFLILAAAAPADGQKYAAADGKNRVMRGDSWINRPNTLRAAARNYDNPKKHYDNSDFHVVLTAPQQNREPCGREELKFFDPLLGEWEQRDGAAKMKITRILDGCVIQEVWEFADFSAVLLRNYDSRTKKWYLTFTAHDLVPQVWEGRLENGNWIFYRDWQLNGRPRRSRTYWTFAKAGFTKIVEQLNDDGKTWRLHVKDVFQKRTPR